METGQKGKTIWEMLTERLHKGGSNGDGIPFFNPLDLRVGSGVPISYSNGAEFADYEFAVQEIREYTRRIGEQDFRFSDYILSGVNKKSFEAEKGMIIRLRAVPNQAGAHDTLLLKLLYPKERIAGLAAKSAATPSP